MELLIVFLPIIGVFINLLSYNLFGRYTIKLNIIILFITTLLTYIMFYQIIILQIPNTIITFKWFNTGLISVYWGFTFNSFSILMLTIVNTISLLVHIYSLEYMANDPHKNRFFAYLSLFTFLMLILVTGNNLIQTFVGWEGVGISSYLLISFWYTRIQANKSAIKAIIVNKIGDSAFLIGMFGIHYLFKTFNYDTIFSLIYLYDNTYISILNYNINILTFLCLFFFLGAMGKSAQIILHTWLPDAMEGPTPVSALIHAATMVTAGVFLIIKLSVIIEFSSVTLIIITIIGAMTSFFASIVAIAQNDLKRIIAYSTCSQLGYMFFVCGISSYNVGAFHLFNHAFFKALLFLSAGNIIHALNDEQDIRKMGGLNYVLPITYTFVFIGSLALMGIPFLTGFYSKDVIIELAYSNFKISSFFAYWLGTLSAFFTAFYSFRLMYYVFFNDPRNSKVLYTFSYEPSYYMLIPCFILVFLSIFIGYLTKDMMIGMGTNFWNNSIYIKPTNLLIIESEFLNTYIKNIPVIFSICGFFISLIIYRLCKKLLTRLVLTENGKFLYLYLNKKWFFDSFYNFFIIKYILKIGYFITFKLLDKGFIELIGPDGLIKTFLHLSKKLSSLHTGQIYHYAFIVFTGLLFILLFILYYNYLAILLDLRLMYIWIFGIFLLFAFDNDK
uniref:NADH-ubiquinone oxidoreductase chain 5 n=1 Tax=Gefionella okellyi TaxID=2853422 RepID=A0A0B5H4T4_9EUKA|nr:NADH dehydrogenase subunit 5 [Gefionella okellyi]